MTRYYAKPLSKLPTPPCKKEKCLKYPICISEEALDCQHLVLYYEKLMASNYVFTAKTAWLKVNKVLPNLERLHERVTENSGFTYVKDHER